MRLSQTHHSVEESFVLKSYCFLLTVKDTLHVALDVTSNGQLQLPPYPSNPTSAIHNITIFLSSYDTGRNFTVSNGTASVGSLGEIMQMEPGSTVKHINWIWPDCLVGDGNPDGSNSTSRGAYNVWIKSLSVWIEICTN